MGVRGKVWDCHEGSSSSFPSSNDFRVSWSGSRLEREREWSCEKGETHLCSSYGLLSAQRSSSSFGITISNLAGMLAWAHLLCRIAWNYCTNMVNFPLSLPAECMLKRTLAGKQRNNGRYSHRTLYSSPFPSRGAGGLTLLALSHFRRTAASWFIVGERRSEDHLFMVVKIWLLLYCGGTGRKEGMGAHVGCFPHHFSAPDTRQKSWSHQSPNFVMKKLNLYCIRYST